MDKRYQVFVSSTFSDLKDERQEVMHALLELDCIPSGMELFPAANETQWDLIKRVIEDCDYYLLILGGRYGSIAPSGLSYTEMEFDYAVSLRKPIISFLHRDPQKIEVGKSEMSKEGKEQYDLFREKTEKRMCKFWESPVELGSVVSRSLIQLIKREPAIGWIKADKIANKDAAHELLKLREQVDLLKAELSSNKISAPKGTENLAQGSEEFEISFSFEAETENDLVPEEWSATCSLEWDQIFYHISPLMLDKCIQEDLESSLNGLIAIRERDLHKRHKILKNAVISSVKICTEDFHTILIQLRALNLIKKTDTTRLNQICWAVTEYGDTVMTRLRAIKRSEECKLTATPL